MDNAARHADCTIPEAIVPWPADILQPEKLTRIRAKGEFEAVEYIYESIRGCAAKPASLQNELQRRTRIALGHASRHREWSRMVSSIGHQGASEIAAIVLSWAGKAPDASQLSATPSIQHQHTKPTKRSTLVAYEGNLHQGLEETLLISNVLLGISASAVLLAALCTLGPVGGQVIMPAWSCQSVISASLLSGMVPVLADVDESFGMVLPVQSEPGSIVLYTPYGGNTHDLQRVSDWCTGQSVELILDFAQVADQSVWHNRPRDSFCLSSFGPSKPLAGAGGGVLTGPADLLCLAQDFLRGGVTQHGEKTGLGMALGMQPSQFTPAAKAIKILGKSQAKWRAQSRLLLSDSDGLFSGWEDCSLALSRIPRTGRRDLRPANPESTYMSPGWRRALSSRHRVCDSAHQANFYQEIYSELSVQKPDLTEAGQHR